MFTHLQESTLISCKSMLHSQLGVGLMSSHLHHVAYNPPRANIDTRIVSSDTAVLLSAFLPAVVSHIMLDHDIPTAHPRNSDCSACQPDLPRMKTMTAVFIHYLSFYRFFAQNEIL
jgi:hypothetical protein